MPETDRSKFLLSSAALPEVARPRGKPSARRRFRLPTALRPERCPRPPSAAAAAPRAATAVAPPRAATAVAPNVPGCERAEPRHARFREQTLAWFESGELETSPDEYAEATGRTRRMAATLAPLLAGAALLGGLLWWLI